MQRVHFVPNFIIFLLWCNDSMLGRLFAEFACLRGFAGEQ